MQNFFEWLEKTDLAKREWLIVGKGPSFSKIKDVPDRYEILSLNHAVRELMAAGRPVTLAHAIDLDVIKQLSPEVLKHPAHFAMPFHPHIGFNATSKTIDSFDVIKPISDRLLWYNLVTGKAHDKTPVVQTAYFSAEAAVSLLALAGVKTIRTIGVDGGDKYAGEFKDLKPFTGGHKSFDVQWEGINRTVQKFEIDFAKL